MGIYIYYICTKQYSTYKQEDIITKDVSLNLHGLDLVVTVEYEDNAVCAVVSVRPECSQMALKCDIARFYDELIGELQEALENAIADDKIACYENLMDDRKEEWL